MKYVLGIDFGGGSSKAALLSEGGTLAASAGSEYPTYYPNIGYAEQNPDDWYKSAKENIRAVIDKSGVNPCDIVCVALDAATHTAVLCDDDFNVVRPSIYWTDTRCTDEVRYLTETHAELIKKKSYHSAGTIWTLPQIMWVKNNESENFSRIKRIMFAKDYVRHMLTGDFVTDIIEAEGSMLFDMESGNWSDELCKICGIERSMLPEIKRPGDMAGAVTARAAADTGLCEGTSVICGTTDTVMEVFASGAVEKGNMTLKLATAGRICVITDKPYPDINLVNYSHTVSGLWYPGTATKSCAASMRWFRDTFGGDYKDFDETAEKINAGSDGLIFHPYLNGELTPYQDPSLCGSFTGIRGGHTKAHFARAVMEGVAMSMLDCMKTLDSLGISHDSAARIIGGGSKSPLWRQITADCLGIELSVGDNTDSSFGSAMLAGIAAGFWKNEKDALAHCSKVVSTTAPNSENTKKYAEIFKKYKRIHDALEDVYR